MLALILAAGGLPTVRLARAAAPSRVASSTPAQAATDPRSDPRPFDAMATRRTSAPGTRGVPEAASRSVVVRGVAAPGTQDVDGKAVYLRSCKQCHGVLGVPTKTAQRQYEKIKALNDPAFYTQRSDAALVEVVTKGKGEMKGFAEKLTEAEIRAVVQYIHTLAKHSG